MWFLNKNTNVKWFVIDKEHKARLLNDEDYEIINMITEKVDLESLTYVELQGLAKENGLKASGKKKEELINELKEVL